MKIKYKFLMITCFFILFIHNPFAYALDNANQLKEKSQITTKIEKSLPYYSFLVNLEKKITLFSQIQQSSSIEQMKKSLTYKASEEIEEPIVNITKQTQALYGKDETLTSPIMFGATVERNNKIVNGTFQYEGKEFIAICVVFDSKCYSSRFIFKEQQSSEKAAFETIAKYLPSDGKETGKWSNKESQETTVYYNSQNLAKQFGSNYKFLSSNAGDYVLLYKYDLKGIYTVTISIGQKP